MKRFIASLGRAGFVLALVCSMTAASCTTGLGQLQTARTLEKGEFRSTISAGLDRNFTIQERSKLPGYPILQYAARWGVHDNLDMGAKLFFGLGALVDAKLQVINCPRLAVSLLGGAGGAYDHSSGAEILHVPLLLLASYRVAERFTPYAGAGYGAFWIFNYRSSDYLPAGATLAPRAWHGDGLMMLHVGFEIALTSRSALLLEYGYLRPIVDDPGDRYDFAVNHLVLGGVQF